MLFMIAIIKKIFDKNRVAIATYYYCYLLSLQKYFCKKFYL
jgi:hypothetical protein